MTTTKTGRAGGVPGAADTLKGLGIGAAITVVLAVIVSIVSTHHPEQTTTQALTITSAPSSSSYAILPDVELVTDEGSDHTGRPYIESHVKLTAERRDYSSAFAPRFAIVVSDPVTGESFRCEVSRSFRWSDSQMNYTPRCDTTVPHERVAAFTTAVIEDTTPGP